MSDEERGEAADIEAQQNGGGDVIISTPNLISSMLPWFVST